MDETLAKPKRKTPECVLRAVAKYHEKNIDVCRLRGSSYSARTYHKSKCGCKGEDCPEYAFLVAKQAETMKLLKESLNQQQESSLPTATSE